MIRLWKFERHFFFLNDILYIGFFYLHLKP